ncbi:MAG TPA: enoyl-CoA hydratase-related protein [Myxococcota bacterium]|nr:enoyl-CoA hydratase-related protein [Myxococcota bacterium]
MSELLREVKDGVLTLTINREERRNALNRAVLDALEAALTAADEDPDVRAIVLRGAGEKSFCAGADLAEMLSNETIEASRRQFDGLARVIRRMHAIGPPVIARVPGYALAGGFGLAVACDFTIASESAQFGLPEIGIGILPLMVSAPLYRALGSRKALLDLVLTGRRVPAREAHALGLVTRVVPDGELDAAVNELAATLASHSPTAVRLGKEAIYTMAELEYDAALRYLRDAIVLTSRTEDAAEGIRAFFEKRKPVWRGR